MKSSYVLVYKGHGELNGDLPFVRWIKGLRDVRGKQAIEARLARVRLGNLGDHRPVGDGVTELRFFIGPGYRVYIGLEGDTAVILLCGGDKGSLGWRHRNGKSILERLPEEQNA